MVNYIAVAYCSHLIYLAAKAQSYITAIVSPHQRHKGADIKIPDLNAEAEGNPKGDARVVAVDRTRRTNKAEVGRICVIW